MIKKILKCFLFGFLTWLVPFVVSIFFYTGGKLSIDVLLFKAIMIVTGSISASILLILYFKKIDAYYFKEGLIVGIIWFSINILLDLLILLPMSKMSLPDYFTQIGLSYIVIPVMCITVGTVLANKK